MTTAFPLDWPDGWPRTAFHKQRKLYSQFGDLTMNKAVTRLLGELRLLGATDVVLSTNVPLRQSDGLPRADYQRYDDSGVAVYFRRAGRQLCMAHDAWQRVEANVNALALAISGLRQMERHGGAAMVERAFSGFSALPPPGAVANPDPWHVLGITPTRDTKAINLRYRELAKELHSDAGGDDGAMARLNVARDEALRRASA